MAREQAEEELQVREAIKRSEEDAKLTTTKAAKKHDLRSPLNPQPAHPIKTPTTSSRNRGRRRPAEFFDEETPEAAEERQLRQAVLQSKVDERAAEERRRRAQSQEKDVALVVRLTAAEEEQRAKVEAEARRVAAEVTQRETAARRQLDDRRRLLAVEKFVERAAFALQEWAQMGQLRQGALTIGVAAASELLTQTLQLEAAGGMLKNDNSGQRKSAGGVYFFLLKENLSREEWKVVTAAKAGSRDRNEAEGGLALHAAYLRDVPLHVTPKDVSDALRARFGPTAKQSGNMRTKLRSVGQYKHGRVLFRSERAKEKAVAKGKLLLSNGCTIAIDGKPTEGLHYKVALAAEGEEGVVVCTSEKVYEEEEDEFEQLKLEEEPWMLIDEKSLGVAVSSSYDGSGGEHPDGDAEEEYCPDDFICPITLEQLKEPVVAADGLTYERSALQGWLDKHAEDATVLSPATGAPLAHRNLTPDTAILEKMASVGRLATWLCDRE